ncbi:helix-turn-helix transcriptional regulator [Amycolatopsis suaedae]|uniref:Helix-turn-helix transcriptional regulator n=1 Tax=Amycolatopsis suaedae TaxID=2510978 RepID=A0A4Q7J881_9PSEU|nr:helix-turn-helix transcriptional regulator [Amycolatopsis suaedae]RZQ63168.1 helix-turn-helix transcriptional regulator [Amycolatopsis suaedae]
MTGDPQVDALIQQWSAEREQSAEEQEANRIAAAWLAETPTAPPGIPGQRGSGGGSPAWAVVDAADPGYLEAMRRRLPDVPVDLLAAAASWWQMVGGVAEAERWWDAGLSPLDQRALDYRAAGLSPEDLSRRLGPMTVLQHLRRGSAPAWCVARLARQRRDAAS